MHALKDQKDEYGTWNMEQNSLGPFQGASLRAQGCQIAAASPEGIQGLFGRAEVGGPSARRRALNHESLSSLEGAFLDGVKNVASLHCFSQILNTASEHKNRRKERGGRRRKDATKLFGKKKR